MQTDGKTAYFRDYVGSLNIFLYKESLSLTMGEYMCIVLEIERIREYIEFLEYNELINIEVNYEKTANTD